MATEPKTLDDFDLAGGKPHPCRRMTEEEFEAWIDEDTRAEWVDGEVVMMAPADLTHTRLDIFLICILQSYCEHHDLGAVLGPEFTVRLRTPRRRRVPDVLFVAKGRMKLVKQTYVNGAPDLIMEIVSADSVSRDWREKFLDYEKGGVREYWIIDPNARRVEAYRLANGRYVQIAVGGNRIASTVVRGFFLKPEWLWRNPLPSIAATEKQLGIR